MAIARSPQPDREPLESAFERFSEGFDTADLMEARGILASVGGATQVADPRQRTDTPRADPVLPPFAAELDFTR